MGYTFNPNYPNETPEELEEEIRQQEARIQLRYRCVRDLALCFLKWKINWPILVGDIEKWERSHRYLSMLKYRLRLARLKLPPHIGDKNNEGD